MPVNLHYIVFICDKEPIILITWYKPFLDVLQMEKFEINWEVHNLPVTQEKDMEPSILIIPFKTVVGLSTKCAKTSFQ